MKYHVVLALVDSQNRIISTRKIEGAAVADDENFGRQVLDAVERALNAPRWAGGMEGLNQT